MRINRIKRIRAIAPILGCTLIFVLNCAASVFTATEIKTLSELSTHVVEGVVVAAEFQKNQFGIFPQTAFDVNVSQSLKGADVLALRFSAPGGREGNRTYTIDDVIEVNVGDTYMLFLQTVPKSERGLVTSNFKLTSIATGAFQVVNRNGQKYVRAKINPSAFEPGANLRDYTRDIPYDEFLDMLKRKPSSTAERADRVQAQSPRDNTTIYVSRHKWDLNKNDGRTIIDGKIIWTFGTAATSNPRCLKLVQEQFDKWSRIDRCRIGFTLVPQNKAPVQDYRGGNTIGWSTKPGPFFSADILAFTYNSDTLVDNQWLLSDSDIVFNDGYGIEWTDDRVLWTALHEIGHMIGLKHSPDPQSIMYAYYNAQTQLGAAEVLAAQTLYPSAPQNDANPGVPFAPFLTLSGSPATGSAPLETAFTANVVSNPPAPFNSFVWDFGDGTTSTEAAPTHTFTSPGFHIISLTVINGANLVGINTFIVEVEETIVMAADFKFHTGNKGSDIFSMTLTSPAHAGFPKAVSPDGSTIATGTLLIYNTRFIFDLVRKSGKGKSDENLKIAFARDSGTVFIQLKGKSFWNKIKQTGEFLLNADSGDLLIPVSVGFSSSENYTIYANVKMSYSTEKKFFVGTTSPASGRLPR